jgi:hypothetical protein
MIKHRFFWILILVAFFTSCKDPKPPVQEKEIQLRTEQDNFQFLYGLFNGKRLKYIPGNYDRTGTRVVFIDRHNDAWPDTIIDSILIKKKISALDSTSLKTVTAVIKNINRRPLNKFLDGANSIDSSDFFILYIDIKSLTVKRIVSYNDSGDYQLRLADKISETY